MNQVIKTIKPALFCFVIMTILCGILYPSVVTGIAQAVFPNQANGSIIMVTLDDGTKKEYGSALIGQEFTNPEHLIGRPIGVTNLSPVSEEQEKLVAERVAWWHDLDPENTANIPADLITASGSGFDPNISPDAAEYQVERIAREREIDADTVRKIVKKCTNGRFLGIWGESAVNVLEVNLILDGLQESE